MNNPKTNPLSIYPELTIPAVITIGTAKKLLERRNKIFLLLIFYQNLPNKLFSLYFTTTL
jgi:hypothetical protein